MSGLGAWPSGGGGGVVSPSLVHAPSPDTTPPPPGLGSAPSWCQGSCLHLAKCTKRWRSGVRAWCMAKWRRWRSGVRAWCIAKWRRWRSGVRAWCMASGGGGGVVSTASTWCMHQALRHSWTASTWCTKL